MSNSVILFSALLLAATTAPAQIAPSSPSSQRAAHRSALREARRVESPYTDSHLAVARPLKRGEMEPNFDRDGRPHVTEPKYPGLRLRKHQTESLR
jgi:hypothetical protein